MKFYTRDYVSGRLFTWNYWEMIPYYSIPAFLIVWDCNGEYDYNDKSETGGFTRCKSGKFIKLLGGDGEFYYMRKL